jgi:hypothetical protein
MKPEDQPTQKTEKGTEIPVPKRQTFIRNLNRAIKADPEKVEPKPKRRRTEK